MKQLGLVAALVAVLSLASAQAQGPILPGPGLPVAGTIYQGPGDVASGATAWYGFFAYSGAVASAHQNAYRVCDTATESTCTTITYLTNGHSDDATAAASAACAVSCRIVTFFNNISGGAPGDAAQSIHTGGVVTFNSLGTCPTFAVSGQTYRSTSFTAQAQPWTFVTVAERTGAFTTAQTVIGDVAGNAGLQFQNTANTVNGYASSQLTHAATDSTWHALQLVANGASSVTSVDGSTTTGNAGTSNISQLQLDTDAFANAFTNGAVVAWGFWPSNLTSTLASVSTNLHTQCGGF